MWRLVILTSLALTTACGGDDQATNDGSNGDPANFATTDATQSDGASQADDDDDGQSASEPEVVEAPCELTTGMCPNACEHGPSDQGESCVTDVDCGCGFCCGFGQCKSFDSVGCESFASRASVAFSAGSSLSRSRVGRRRW